MKQLTTGFIFALTCFTDPTYYAVMLMGGETGNFLSAVVLLTLWFLVSQFLAVIVYIANEMNLLEKLVDFIKKFKQKNWKAATYLFYGILILIAIVLLVDTGYYLLVGNYLLQIFCLKQNFCIFKKYHLNRHISSAFRQNVH